MDEASLQRAGWSGLMRGLSACFSVLSLAALLALAGKGSIPLHRVIEVMAMTGLLAGALADLVRALELAVPARIAHAKIAARFAEGAQPAEGQDVKRNPSSKTVLELCEFRIETDAEPFDCTVRRGDRIALECGPESSASSVFAMIAGLSLPASGGVFHCGRPALSLSQARRRNRIGIAAPWLPLLRTKARGNASYRLRGWAELPMQHLAKRLQLTEVLVRNPLVDPASSAVSAHELAGLCVLRAVAGQPDLLLLDEADQHLLPEQVSALAEIIASWPGAVIFTCRSAALREQANRTWHLASGTLKEAQPGIGPRLAFSTMR